MEPTPISKKEIYLMRYDLSGEHGPTREGRMLEKVPVHHRPSSSQQLFKRGNQFAIPKKINWEGREAIRGISWANGGKAGLISLIEAVVPVGRHMMVHNVTTQYLPSRQGDKFKRPRPFSECK